MSVFLDDLENVTLPFASQLYQSFVVMKMEEAEEMRKRPDRVVARIVSGDGRPDRTRLGQRSGYQKTVDGPKPHLNRSRSKYGHFRWFRGNRTHVKWCATLLQ
jgi:hypothetical protein